MKLNVKNEIYTYIGEWISIKVKMLNTFVVPKLKEIP